MSMENRPPIYEEELADGLVQLALDKINQAAAQGKVISSISGTALAFRERGREFLRQMLDSSQERSNVAQEIDFYLGSLSGEGKRKLTHGIGFVIAGCSVQAIENGIWDGWDENVYLALFYQDITGTPIPQIPKERLKATRAYQQNRPNNEQDRLTNLAKQDRTFDSFLNHPDNLPPIIQAHLAMLNEYILQEFFTTVVPIFHITIVRLNSLLAQRE